MKITYAIISALLVLGMSSAVFAAPGVEAVPDKLVLPADAHDVVVKSAALSSYAIGEKLVGATSEGNLYENVYETRLEVIVAYKSKDSTDAPQSYDGMSPRTDTRPQRLFYLQVSKGTIDAIEGGKDPVSVVNLNVTEKEVEVLNNHYQYQCRHDSDSSRKLDDDCKEAPIPTVTVVRRVLDIK
jgi:hypothetical protein